MATGHVAAELERTTMEGKERPWIGREELLSLGSMRAYVCGGGQREREGEITSRGDELGLDRS